MSATSNSHETSPASTGTAVASGPQKDWDLDASENYFNRELSWLEFNARVLGEALHERTPLLERLKFLSIFSSNLDEFFMVRVAGLKKLVREDIQGSDSPDSLSTREVLAKIKARVMDLVKAQYNCLLEVVLPALRTKDVVVSRVEDLPGSAREYLAHYFRENVFPVLTPLAVDPAHPFPFLSNGSIYLYVVLSDQEAVVSEEGGEAQRLIGLVEVPTIIPRLVPVGPKPAPGGVFTFVRLEDLIQSNLESLFLGFNISAAYPIRVTRNADYNLLESEVVDLLKTIQREVTSREHSEPVRLEIPIAMPAEHLASLRSVLQLDEEDVYIMPGPLVPNGFMLLYDLPLKDGKDLRDPPFNPRLPQAMEGTEDIFKLLGDGELLVHHPYESFYAVIEFLTAAAHDPHVLAIKQTLYRTSGDSPIIEALIAAAENGKQVTAVVELKARFDEKNNIVWARRLERAGVNVVFGFIGLKTHAKATLVIRREKNNRLVRYVHLSTGNYNSSTAKFYTDLGFFTCDDDIGHDVTALFNLLTGFNVLTGETKLRKKSAFPTFKKIVVAPVNLRQTFLRLIDREIEERRKGGRGLIIAKMNSLVDKDIIRRLYEASRAGVEVKLIVRGICCLKPGIAGLSDNIEVLSIVDRFLEHSRIYYFYNAGIEEVYLASADLMPRNMDRRVEIMFPVSHVDLRKRLVEKILTVCLADNVKARRLNGDGTYTLKSPGPGEVAIRSQERFIDWAREGGIQSIPYDQAIRHNPLRKKGARPVAKKSTSPKKPPPPSGQAS